MNDRFGLRLSEEEKRKAQEQAKKLFGENGTISDYIRLMINLDAAEVLIQGFRAEGTRMLKKLGEVNPKKAEQLGMAKAIHKIAFEEPKK